MRGQRRFEDNNVDPIRTCPEVAEHFARTEGVRMRPGSIWQSEKRALKKIREGLRNDPYIREWARENGVVCE